MIPVDSDQPQSTGGFLAAQSKFANKDDADWRI